MTNQTKMGRPRILQNATKLTLCVDLNIKQKLFAMATERGISISAVVRDFVRAAAQKPESTEAA